jgi:hypothetical protein
MGAAQPEVDVMAKIQATKNYRLFHRHEGENRPLEPNKRRKLKNSMKRYGFLECFPIVCYRDKSGNLIVKDGQHRLTLAEELGLTIHWVETSSDFDVAIVNSTVKGWTNKDYAHKHATNGIAAYQDILEFSERFKLAVSLSAMLLGGTTCFQNISGQFYEGTFKIKDRKWAESVAGLYAQMIHIGPALKNNHFLAACMAVCRVPEFEPKRLLGSAERCREKLVAYANREAYLDLLETVYNFGRSRLCALKMPALAAMRDRNPRNRKPSENGKSQKKELVSKSEG